jgi:cytochrome c
MFNKFKKASLLAASLVVMFSSSAFAVDGKELYNTKGCAGCHGTDAKSPVMPQYPKIAGQNKEYAEQQLKDIKSGDRSNGQSAAMKSVMITVSAEEITALAGYLSELK